MSHYGGNDYRGGGGGGGGGGYSRYVFQRHMLVCEILDRGTPTKIEAGVIPNQVMTQLPGMSFSCSLSFWIPGG
jgi:hypothetical protein